MKRALMKAAAMLLALALPVAAHGQTVRQTVVEDGRTRETLVTFAQDAPQAVRDLMGGHGLGDARCVCGAALEVEPMAGDGNVDGLLFTSSALMVVERGGAYALVGLRWEPGGSNARVEDFGAMGLPLGEGCSVRPLWDENKRLCDFELLLPVEAGEERWRFDCHTVSGWQLREYTDTAGRRTAFSLNAEVETDGERFCVPVKTWLAERTRLDSLPLTAGEARRLEEESRAALEGTDLCLIWGANLRTEPTSRSRSLGMYHVALAQVLGQEPGTEVPWYHVRVGETEGYVSGRYAAFPADWANFVRRASVPCPVAETDGGPLMGEMDGGALCTLEAERRLLVLAETEDGWLHVFVPEDEPDGTLDQPGTYGYLRREDVTLWLGTEPVFPPCPPVV